MSIPQASLNNLDHYVAGSATNQGTKSNWSRARSVSTYEASGVAGKPFHKLRSIDRDRAISQAETVSSSGVQTLIVTLDLATLSPGTIASTGETGTTIDKRHVAAVLKPNGKIAVQFRDGSGVVHKEIESAYSPTVAVPFILKIRYGLSVIQIIVTDKDGETTLPGGYSTYTHTPKNLPAMSYIADWDPGIPANLVWHSNPSHTHRVITIKDKSGNGHDLQYNNLNACPIHNLHTIGGHRALNFWLPYATDANKMEATIATGSTVDTLTTFAVMQFKRRGLDQRYNYSRILQYAGGSTAIFYKKSDGKLEIKTEGNSYNGGERPNVFWASHIQPGEPFLLTVESLRNKSTIRINGIQVATANRTATMAANSMVVDGTIDLGNHSDIQIARCMLVKDISTANRDATEAHLLEKYHLKKEMRTEATAEVSPNLKNNPPGSEDSTQGVAWDGTYYYLTGVRYIEKRNAAWGLVATSDGNPTMMPGMTADTPGNYNTRRHFGGLDVVGDELHIAYRTQVNNPSIQYIIVYDKNTLLEKRVMNIGATCGDASGLGYNARDNKIYVGGFTTVGRVWVYSVGGVFEKELILSHWSNSCQGLCFYNDRMYISTGYAGTSVVHSYDLDGSSVSLVAKIPSNQEPEGICFVGDTLKFLTIDNNSVNRVHSFPRLDVGSFENLTPTNPVTTEYGDQLDADFYSLGAALHGSYINATAETAIRSEMSPIIIPVTGRYSPYVSPIYTSHAYDGGF